MHSLETQESRTLSCIFSEYMPLSWFKVKFMFYVDNYSFCSLGNTTELTIFCVSFPVKGTYEGIFYQSCRLIFTNCNFTKDGLLLQVFFFFWIDKKCRSIIFRWLLLFFAFTQVVFTEKVCFIETTSFNYSFTETWSIQQNLLRRFLVGTHYQRKM